MNAPKAVVQTDPDQIPDERVRVTQRRASDAYVPGRFDGTIDFIWAVGPKGAPPRPSPISRWRMLSDTVREHSIQSNHIGLITNNLTMLADVLRNILGTK